MYSSALLASTSVTRSMLSVLLLTYHYHYAVFIRNSSEPSLSAATVQWLRWEHNTGAAVAHWNGIHDLGLPADIPITVYVHSF